MSKPALKLQEQRYMVSPCGFKADFFHIDEIAEQAPGWTDCTTMSDASINDLMVRRMQASSVAALEAA